jgi:hypothetical protein
MGGIPVSTIEYSHRTITFGGEIIEEFNEATLIVNLERIRMIFRKDYLRNIPSILDVKTL